MDKFMYGYKKIEIKNRVRLFILGLGLVFIIMFTISPSPSAFGQNKVYLNGSVYVTNESDGFYHQSVIKDIYISILVDSEHYDYSIVSTSGEYTLEYDGQYPVNISFSVIDKPATLQVQGGSEVVLSGDNQTVTIPLLHKNEYEVSLVFPVMSLEEIESAKMLYEPEEPVTPLNTSVNTTQLSVQTLPVPDSPAITSEEMSTTEELDGQLPTSDSPGSLGEAFPFAWTNWTSWLLIIGGTLIIASIVFLIARSIKKRNDEVYYRKDNRSQAANHQRDREPIYIDHFKEKTENARLRVELEEYKGFFESHGNQLKQLQAQEQRIPELQHEYSLLAIRVKQLSSMLKEPVFAKITEDVATKDDYVALKSAIYTLKTVYRHLQANVQLHQKLIKDCRDIIAAISSSGIDTSVYEKYMNETNVSGLIILKAALTAISKRVEKKESSPELIEKLNDYKERIGQVRDYAYRIPVATLLSYAEEMVCDAYPAEEMILREKTAEEILNAVDRYLKL